MSGWCKLNSYGSSLGNPGRAGGGGVIRNAYEDWVSGYAGAIGNITSVAAELWALRDGIDLCLAMNLPTVEIELDAKLVVDLLKKEGGNLNGNDVIVDDCREGLKKIPLVRIQHCYREANKCVDALVRLGRELFLLRNLLSILNHLLMLHC